MKKVFITTILTFLFVLGLSGSVWAESVGLEWNAATDNVGVAGYKVYQGTATGVYGAPVDVGDVLTHTITGLNVGITYFWAVTAYDVALNESVYSNEVSQLVIDTTAPAGITTLKIIIIMQ